MGGKLVLYPPGDPSHFVVFVCMLLSWLFHVNCYISSSLSLRMVLFSSLPSGLLETVASVSLTTILPSVSLQLLRAGSARWGLGWPWLWLAPPPQVWAGGPGFATCV